MICTYGCWQGGALPPGINGFSFGGIRSERYRVIITEPPLERFPEWDHEVREIPGRSGALVLSNGRYKNLPRAYACAVLPDDGVSMRESVISFVGSLAAQDGYQRLADTYTPGFHYSAMLADAVDVESIMEQAGTFNLTFTRKPQRFLCAGEHLERFSAPGELLNPTGFAARPLITVYGSGPGNLTVGGVTVQIKALTDKLTLDCDTMNAYRQAGDGPAENRNGDIYAPEFPELAAGRNAVTWTGGIASVDIVPRWWTL